MSNLTRLSLTSNLLSGNLPTDTSVNLSSLQNLYLDQNELSGPIFHVIKNCSNLVILEISQNLFMDTIPNTIGDTLSSLQIFNLINNTFTNDPSVQELVFITSLTNCRFLRILALDVNPLQGILPSSIGNFSNLQHLSASVCNITGYIPNEIGNLSSLIFLSLTGNGLVGSIPTTVRGLQMIQRFDFQENKLMGSFPDDLCTFENLVELFLAVNKLSGPIPQCLGNVTSLRYIDLHSNEFNSSIPSHFWNLTDILTFDLSSNFISGSLSSDIGNLKAADQIVLSFNKFTGSIPSTIGNLQRMVYLILGSNELEGSIPDSVDKMLSLEFFDLSSNKLSGVIPKSMETLEHLVYFNVSVNNLSGEIPSIGPFRNFTNESFMFNRDLCGDPRFNVPRCRINHVDKSRKKKMILSSSVGGAIVIVTIIVFLLLMIKYRKRNQNLDVMTLPLSSKGQRRISYYELQQATNWYNESNLIGTGGFGSVYKGVLSDGTVLAVKVFKLEVQGSLKSFDAECQVFRNLRHRNLTKVICSCSNEEFKALVLDYMPNGSLDRWLYSHNFFLDIEQRLNILIDVGCALEYLHHGYLTPVIHCDLKPSNVLLDEDMVGHVSDFGMAKLLIGDGTTIHTRTLATFGYMAPEYGMEGIVSSKCDVYSYGVMLMEVFTRTKPNDEIFDGDMSMKKWVQDCLLSGVLKIVDSNLIDTKEQHFNEKLKCLVSIMELAISCTAQSAKDRPSMTDVLSVIKNINCDLLKRHS